MKILLSPAKSLKDCSTNTEGTNPLFEKETKEILKKMKTLSVSDLSKTMNVSENIAKLNFERFKNFNNAKNKNPAIFVFDGDVFKGLDIENFNKKEIKIANENIRILSGMYGILRPLDKISPYRLEMGTRISINSNKNLYDFWKQTLTEELKKSLDKNEIIINLASVEYSKAINFKKIPNKVITPIFMDFKDEKYKVISFYAKKARGLMAKYIIKNNIKNISQLKKFNLEGYKYNKELSSEEKPVFTRK